MLMAEILRCCTKLILDAARIRAWLVVLSALLLAGCGPPADRTAAPIVLVHVGMQTVSVDDFEAAFAISQMAYDFGDLQQPAIWREARLRLLNELVEEALVLEEARILGIQVSAEEVDEAERRIREDYPEGVFEAVLLENAVQYPAWRERLRVRRLLEKTVWEVLGAQVAVTPEALAAILADSHETGPGNAGGQLVQRLKRRQVEAAYPEWVRRLRQELSVEINQPEWERLLKAPQS